MGSKSKSPTPASPTPWRDLLSVHPAAEMFPMMSESEIAELAEDIRENGLHDPAMVFTDLAGKNWWLDARNRLDALALLGVHPTLRKPRRGTPESVVLIDSDGVVSGMEWAGYLFEKHGDDPWAYVISKNIRRRHLTNEQKRKLIADLIKRAPDKSDRQIAEDIRSSPTTVGAVRHELEERGDVSKLDTRFDSKGRQQPASKSPKPKSTPGQTVIPAEEIKAAFAAEEAQADRAGNVDRAPNADPIDGPAQLEEPAPAAPANDPPPAATPITATSTEPVAPAAALSTPRPSGGYSSTGANRQQVRISLEKAATQLVYIASRYTAAEIAAFVAGDAALAAQFARIPPEWLSELVAALSSHGQTTIH